MSSVNKVFILGWLGKDPEIRHTADGTPVANMSVATSSFSGKGSDRKEHTEWHKIVAFNQAAEVIQNYVKKGSQIFIEGSLRTTKWQDKEGNDRYTTEIAVGRLTLLGKREGEKSSAQDYAKASGGQYEDDPPF
jgi:single-strand DNA-binding protein